jgi:Tfp pilus assembly protein PilW
VDERGTTLTEVVVGLAMGAIVLAALSTVIVISMRNTSKINAHVDANQRARIALNKVIEQLHSACVAPQIAPVVAGSTGTELIFLHQTGSAVSPTPTKSKISLLGTTLSQSDYVSTGGTAPEWTFSETASPTTQLMTNVQPTAPSSSIFGYYAYANGKIATLLPTPLSAENALRTVVVTVGFTAAPLKTPVGDSNAATSIKSSASLRLTPPSFSANGVNLPCQ